MRRHIKRIVIITIAVLLIGASSLFVVIRKNVIYASLMIAIQQEDKGKIKKILVGNIDVNYKDNPGNTTPLMYSIGIGNTDVVKMIIDAGADVNALSDNSVSPLMGAVIEDNTEIVELLLIRGANPNIQNINGGTALHIAALRGNIAIVQLLIDHGADVKIKTKNGNTAFDIAKKNNHKELLPLLKLR